MESRTLKAIKSSLKEVADFGKLKEEIDETFKHYDTQLKYHLNLDYDPRAMVGDRYEDNSERFYGSPDVKGPDAEHGTHVAGIIAAIRNNEKGLDGVADQVKIMALRVIPDGDERDKDVAWSKAVGESAVRYAQAKDVLLVHAAGNDAKNTDISKNYPTRFYSDSTGLNMGMAQAWLEVGASGWENNEELAADFSNYGKKSVHVFAPGVKIYSSVPDSKYKQINGTSMAAPVVSGLAAILRSYFPKLSAIEVKDLIVQSVQKVEQKVKVKGDQGNTRLSFSDLCSSGGIINAQKAVEMALKTTK